MHTGDFKVAYTPVFGDAIDLARFGEIGKKLGAFSGGMKQRALIAQAVSYTHLDVYKRQV